MSAKPHRERDAAPVPTDIAEKMTALKRKQAKYVSPLLPFFSDLIVPFVAIQG